MSELGNAGDGVWDVPWMSFVPSGEEACRFAVIDRYGRGACRVLRADKTFLDKEGWSQSSKRAHASVSSSLVYVSGGVDAELLNLMQSVKSAHSVQKRFIRDQLTLLHRTLPMF